MYLYSAAYHFRVHLMVSVLGELTSLNILFFTLCLLSV